MADVYLCECFKLQWSRSSWIFFDDLHGSDTPPTLWNADVDAGRYQRWSFQRRAICTRKGFFNIRLTRVQRDFHEKHLGSYNCKNLQNKDVRTMPWQWLSSKPKYLNIERIEQTVGYPPHKDINLYTHDHFWSSNCKASSLTSVKRSNCTTRWGQQKFVYENFWLKFRFEVLKERRGNIIKNIFPLSLTNLPAPPPPPPVWLCSPFPNMNRFLIYRCP